MASRNRLRKKENIEQGGAEHTEKATDSSILPEPSRAPPAPRSIMIVRSDTSSQKSLSPPRISTPDSSPPSKVSFSRESPSEKYTSATSSSNLTPPTSPRRQSHGLKSRFRSASNASAKSGKPEKRISNLLHLQRTSRGRATSNVSIHVPGDLPDIPAIGDVDSASDSSYATEEREAKWEERATILAMSNPETLRKTPSPPRPSIVSETPPRIGALAALEGPSASSKGLKPLTDPKTDDSLQKAISLHEKGDLTQSTAIFSRLAQPSGPNNPLAQVLYGLALRHGWGVPTDSAQAVLYLSLAASSSASIESLALRSGMKSGGAAKGELTLAMFELGNCYRRGWGVKKDPVGARTYYEVAANLGDIDACREAAWCCVEGFGGGKDKKKAAGYLRRAQVLEKEEGKVGGGVGESWVWKEKYDP